MMPGVSGRRHIVITEVIARGRVIWVECIRQGVAPVVVLGDMVKAAAYVIRR